MDHIWITYDWDHGPYPIAAFATCEEAARSVARKGYGKVAKWMLGTDFDDAINAWESADDAC